jgi:bifunctional non-homologous end joining protein LigD
MAEFILVEHNAIKRGKHWDLRFELPNSKNWASFSMNQFPPDEPGKRIYIPRSNDHSKTEALYVGKIPEGQYGAGSLKKVDGGKCEVLKYSNAHIVVDFKGKKISGVYHFVNMGVIRRDYKSKVYTFFKGKIKE